MATVGTPQPFKSSILADTATLYRKKLPLILLIVGGFVALQLYEQLTGRSSGTNISTLAWAILAISVHASILNGSNAIFPNIGKVFVAFLWRSIVLAAPGILVSLSALAITGAVSDLAMLSLFLVYGIVTALILSIAGTWLPAVVADGGDRRLVAALVRGRRVFGYTLFRLTVGCGGIFIVTVGIFLTVITIAISRDWIAQTAGVPSLLTLVLAALLYLVLAFVFVMLPVILSRAYLLAEGISGADEQ